MEPIWFRGQNVDPELDGQFWDYVRRYEESVPTTLWAEFLQRGWRPPEETLLTDDALAQALRRLVYDLSWLHVYLAETEHLDDRELYQELVEIMQHDEMVIWPDDPDSAVTVSFIGGGSEDELMLFLRYYADEDEREYWREHAPEIDLPPMEPPPYRRDWIPRRPR